MDGGLSRWAGGVLALVLLLGFNGLAAANYVEVRRTANLYATPDSDSDVVRHIDPDEFDAPVHLTVTQPDRVDGYFRVRAAGSVQGWIHKSRTRHFAGDPPDGVTDLGAGAADGGPTGGASDGGGPAGAGSAGGRLFYGGKPRVADIAEDLLELENAAYAVGYSERRMNPLWVAHKVGTRRDFSCDRRERFLTDERTATHVNHDDYTGAGYDRGHMAPSATVGNEFGCEAQDETYLMTNIAPQLPALNQKVWGGFENLIQDEYSIDFNGVWVVTGPIFDASLVRRLCKDVELPISFYKIVVREVNGQPDALAIIMDQDAAPQTPVREFVRSVDEVERLTGIDFFAALADDVEISLESQVASGAHWQLDTPLDTDFPGTPRQTCVKPPITRAELNAGVDQ